MRATMRSLQTRIPAAGFLLLVATGSTWALSMENAQEQSCFEIKDPVAVDLSWVGTVESWYYTHMTRFDLYRGAIDLLQQESEDISEYDLYYNGCIKWKMLPGGFDMEGFGGKSASYATNETSEGLKTYDFWMKGGEGNAGSCYTILTDNATYVVNACCLTGDQMVWGGVSTTKALPSESVTAIHNHVESLGFKRKFFTGLRYETCETAPMNNLAELEL